MAESTLQANNPADLSALVRRAGDVFTSGGLVVFPTETVYGIGASAASDAGMAALHALKNQNQPTAFTVHLPSPDAAERYIDTSAPLVRRLLRKVFPGPVTLVVEESEEVISSRLKTLGLPQEARDHVYQRNTVSLRCPDHPLAQHILGSIAAPIVAGSANRPGQAAPHDAEEAARAVGDMAELIVDGGRTRYSKPSTLVRIKGTGSQRRVVVERDGVYDARFIHKMLRWTMLLVCSGNTCRSPMAEGIARQMLAQERGLSEEDLETAGIRVISAGTGATRGAPAADEAVEAMAKSGVDLSRHRSKPLTIELIHESDVIYCMTEGHRRSVLELVPSAVEKTFLLDPNGDIEDPIGAGMTTYQRTAEVIRRRLAQRLKEQQP